MNWEIRIPSKNEFRSNAYFPKYFRLIVKDRLHSRITIEKASKIITKFALKSDMHWAHAGEKFGIEQHVIESIYINDEMVSDKTDAELENGGMLIQIVKIKGTFEQ